jgi:hypothetical protein
MNPIDQRTKEIWNEAEQKQALLQIADLCRKGLSLGIEISRDGNNFQVKGPGRLPPGGGIFSMSGKIIEEGVLALRLDLIKGNRMIRVPPSPFFEYLGGMGEKVRLLPPSILAGGEWCLGVEIRIKATPLGMTRQGVFLEEIKRLNELARFLQAEMPELEDDNALQERYGEFKESLEPIPPCPERFIPLAQEIVSWAGETVDFLWGSASVAIAAPSKVAVEFALGVLARILQGFGQSLGRLLLPSIGSKGLLELSGKAPGTVVIPAIRLSLSASPYELGHEMTAFLQSLSHERRPAVFTGSLEELQTVFHGGQGAKNDPLAPVVRQVPKVAGETLVRFCVYAAGRAEGGLSQKVEQELVAQTQDELQSLPPEEQERLLPFIASRCVRLWLAGVKTCSGQFGSRIVAQSETLGGLSPSPRCKRSSQVQRRFTETLTDPALLLFLKSRIFGQDRALEEEISRLASECLTRPDHQPLRCALQGTPGTAKSESVRLLANFIGVPYQVIDAASLSDPHTARSQLLGSGRGIVQSYQPGRLEQMTKHHTGVVCEVADLDHAVPGLRAALADLFLLVLDKGEAQSAQGGIFSCANILFVFSMNLPGGADERVRKRIGYDNRPSNRELTREVIKEVKLMTSSAFLSRVGTPILFDPLEGRTLGVIVEGVIRQAIPLAIARLGLSIESIRYENDVGQKVLDSMQTNVLTLGARTLLEHGRKLASQSVMEFRKRGDFAGCTQLTVSVSPQGALIMLPV